MVHKKAAKKPKNAKVAKPKETVPSHSNQAAIEAAKLTHTKPNDPDKLSVLEELVHRLGDQDDLAKKGLDAKKDTTKEEETQKADELKSTMEWSVGARTDRDAELNEMSNLFADPEHGLQPSKLLDAEADQLSDHLVSTGRAEKKQSGQAELKKKHMKDLRKKQGGQGPQDVIDGHLDDVLQRMETSINQNKLLDARRLQGVDDKNMPELIGQGTNLNGTKKVDPLQGHDLHKAMKKHNDFAKKPAQIAPAHSRDRHGAQTSDADQIMRGAAGIAPDSKPTSKKEKEIEISNGGKFNVPMYDKIGPDRSPVGSKFKTPFAHLSAVTEAISMATHADSPDQTIDNGLTYERSDRSAVEVGKRTSSWDASGTKKTSQDSYGTSFVCKAGKLNKNTKQKKNPEISTADLTKRVQSVEQHEASNATVILDRDKKRGGFFPQTAYPTTKDADALLSQGYQHDTGKKKKKSKKPIIKRLNKDLTLNAHSELNDEEQLGESLKSIHDKGKSSEVNKNMSNDKKDWTTEYPYF